MMDLGAMICTRSKPLCKHCPVTQYCLAYARGMTDLIPVAKPTKALPTREGAMLILMREDGAVLLQQRPSPGIWGGLWCYPEKDAIHLDDFVISASETLETSVHVFTHFRWNVSLEYMIVDNLEVMGPDYVWYNARAKPLGLAMIVKKTLPMIVERA
jgi:A/G-specific adenine glycosylase